MVKFHFSILTRYRHKIDGIAIMGRDQEDAERKLRQMYHHCEVVRCTLKQGNEKSVHTAAMEDLLPLMIAK